MTAPKDSHITILAIDDDCRALQQIVEILEPAGFTCLGAQDAAAAREVLSQATPDLIVAATNLAGHSGLDLCEKLKRDHHLSDVPVMFLSSTQVPDIIRCAHPTGGTCYYLRKPFDAQVLVQLVEIVTLVPEPSGA